MHIVRSRPEHAFSNPSILFTVLAGKMQYGSRDADFGGELVEDDLAAASHGDGSMKYWPLAYSKLLLHFIFVRFWKFNSAAYLLAPAILVRACRSSAFFSGCRQSLGG